MPEATTEKTEKKVRGKNGGYHPGSGRKPLMDKAEIEHVKGLIAQHGLQVDESDLQKRTRMLRLLDTLYEKALVIYSSLVTICHLGEDTLLGKFGSSTIESRWTGYIRMAQLGLIFFAFVITAYTLAMFH